MKLRIPLNLLLALVAIGLGCAPGAALAESTLSKLPAMATQQLAAAKPGATVTLPAGTFSAGDLAVPSGVALRGAGFDKTIIDARGHDFGLVLRDFDNVTISDLSIRNARHSAIDAQDGRNLTVRRVRLANNLTGGALRNIRDFRVENTVSARNRTGMVVLGGATGTIVNCTLADNSDLSLGVSRHSGGAVWNNVLLNSSIGYFLDANDNLALNHNLVLASYTGNVPGERPRNSLTAWHTLTGHDAQSVTLPVSFAAAEQLDYRPTSSLGWAHDRASTAGWGTPNLAGRAAPSEDIAGQKRPASPGLGAYEATARPSRPADGAFTIVNDGGVKSVGVYTGDGRQITHLFHNLPLRPGQYSFWLPPRDFLGREIAAGEYQVRVLESDVAWKYSGPVANRGKTNRRQDASTFHGAMVAYDESGRFYITQNWAENHRNLRAFDAQSEDALWYVPGAHQTRGLAFDARGDVWLLRAMRNGEMYSLLKLDAKTGAVLPLPGGSHKQEYSGVFSKTASGLAVLGGTFYLADAELNRVYTATPDDLSFKKYFEVASPTALAVDSQRGVLWLVSDGRLVAIDGAGKQLAVSTAVPRPIALAVRDGRLAVASQATGKVHFFDSGNPSQLREQSTLGRGDGPYGPLLADRFFWQQEARERVDLAFSPRGDLAVLDNNRILTFDRDLRPQREHIAVFGNGPELVQTAPAGVAPPRFFDPAGKFSFAVDPDSGKWQAEAHWKPVPSRASRPLAGVFMNGSKQYAIFRDMYPNNVRPLTLVEYDGYVARPLAGFHFSRDRKMMLRQRDSNGDGQIREEDDAQPILGADGQPLRTNLISPYTQVGPDGSLILFPAHPEIGVVRVPLRAAADGKLDYDWAAREEIRIRSGEGGTANIPSPYNFTAKDRLTQRISDIVPLEGGGFAGTLRLGSTPGGGIGSDSDVGGFDARGNLRWLHLVPDQGVYTIERIGELGMTFGNMAGEAILFDDDGLGAGVLGFPRDFGWSGYWIDHPEQVRAFTGKDGRHHLLVGDYTRNMWHWLEMSHRSPVRRAKAPLSVGADAAARLAALPAEPNVFTRRVPPRQVIVPKLKAPLTMDGSMAKWRDAGITPQIVMTPETGSAAISGPRDASATIRLAHEGGNLYVQVIKFDNVVSLHQPAALIHVQDSVEMAINSYVNGFKFNISATTDQGDIITRNRFFAAKLNLALDPKNAPRKVQVLADAREVEERRLIEGLYGIDLSDSPVLVTEFKLPLDATTYADAEGAMVGSKSGDSFWIGFFINDNDFPGLDVQEVLAWPATYNAFAPKEMGALATLE